MRRWRRSRAWRSGGSRASAPPRTDDTTPSSSDSGADLRVLNKYQQVQFFSAFSSVYNDGGLFGIISTAGSNFVEKAVDVATNELLAIATPGQVTELELTQAKNATKSAVLMNLESRAIVAEDIGRQILTYGCRKPVEHFLKCIDELNLNDLTTMAQRILSSPLTMACWGDVDSVPSYDSIGWRFSRSTGKRRS